MAREAYTCAEQLAGGYQARQPDGTSRVMHRTAMKRINHSPIDGHREMMELAIDAMRESEGGGPKVGAVLVKDEGVVAVGRRTSRVHAERAAIEAALASGTDLRGAILFTTLEPCVPLSSTKEACSQLIARVGVRTVFIGRYDTNPTIYREGWRQLRDAGIVLRDFDADLRAKIDEVNTSFAEHFVRGIGPTGGAKFDYLLNEGKFEIQFSETDARTIVTKWTRRGRNSIYAYAIPPIRVALARHAREFSEIDDPRAFDFTYTVAVEVGEIAAFVSNAGTILVKLLEVESGPSTAAKRSSVKIQYEVRAGRSQGEA